MATGAPNRARSRHAALGHSRRACAPGLGASDAPRPPPPAPSERREVTSERERPNQSELRFGRQDRWLHTSDGRGHAYLCTFAENFVPSRDLTRAAVEGTSGPSSVTVAVFAAKSIATSSSSTPGTLASADRTAGGHPPPHVMPSMSSTTLGAVGTAAELAALRVSALFAQEAANAGTKRSPIRSCFCMAC